MIKTYRVRDGKTFGPAGMYKAGMTIEMEEADAAPFLDKLQPMEQVQADVNPPVPSVRNDLNAVIPEELKLLPEEEETEEAFKIEPLEVEAEPPSKSKAKKPGRKKKE